jgi:PAS domain-containing protein
VAAQQHPVEIIMARGLMSNLTTPAFLVDEAGTLVFYNEGAGELLGMTFEEAGPMPAEEWGSRFEPARPDGSPLALEELPLGIALGEGRPAHAPMRITSAQGGSHTIAVTAFPVVGRGGQSGAIAIFWDDSG